jgi:hypothetical protein
VLVRIAPAQLRAGSRDPSAGPRHRNDTLLQAQHVADGAVSQQGRLGSWLVRRSSDDFSVSNSVYLCTWAGVLLTRPSWAHCPTQGLRWGSGHGAHAGAAHRQRHGPAWASKLEHAAPGRAWSAKLTKASSDPQMMTWSASTPSGPWRSPRMRTWLWRGPESAIYVIRSATPTTHGSKTFCAQGSPDVAGFHNLAQSKQRVMSVSDAAPSPAMCSRSPEGGANEHPHDTLCSRSKVCLHLSVQLCWHEPLAAPIARAAHSLLEAPLRGVGRRTAELIQRPAGGRA